MTLENLYKTKALHKEPADKLEFKGLVQSAVDVLVPTLPRGNAYYR